ncbi:MAG: AAA family ATPase [Bacteroidota bacterium]|jgi:hypothetical protein
MSNTANNNGTASPTNIFDNSGRWCEERIFLHYTGKIPSVRRIFNINPETVFPALAKAFGVSMDELVVDDMIHIPRKYYRKQRAYMFLTPTLMASWNNFNTVFELYHDNAVDKADFEKAEQIVKEHFHYGTGPGVVSLFIQDAGGLRIIEKEMHLDVPDIDLYFNESLTVADKQIMDILSDENKKGVLLLHGGKGTGKTSYLRSIISRTDKKVVLIPADMIFGLGGPSLLPHFMSLPDSIIILEDVDQLLAERQGMGNDFVMNLADFCDGLFSDCVRLKFVLTFSSPLAQIDQSIVRHGRTLYRYEFESLSADRCNKLFEKLGKSITADKAMTLAEVFEQAMQGEAKKEKKRIGFK